ncbi:MAG: DUF5993 family protein [Candidatus Dasytiphilus stammeri]
MFFPFLIAFITVISFLLNKKTTGYVLLIILLILTLVWFQYHATTSLNLSF